MLVQGVSGMQFTICQLELIGSWSEVNGRSLCSRLHKLYPIIHPLASHTHTHTAHSTQHTHTHTHTHTCTHCILHPMQRSARWLVIHTYLKEGWHSFHWPIWLYNNMTNLFIKHDSNKQLHCCLLLILTCKLQVTTCRERLHVTWGCWALLGEQKIQITLLSGKWTNLHTNWRSSRYAQLHIETLPFTSSQAEAQNRRNLQVLNYVSEQCKCRVDDPTSFNLFKTQDPGKVRSSGFRKRLGVSSIELLTP